MVIAVFGEPRTAIFAHMDTVGYCVAHNSELVKVGNPKAPEGTILVGTDKEGEVECILKIEKIKKSKEKGVAREKYRYEASRSIAPGTTLTYKPDFKETGKFVSSAYMDDRLGVWNALMQARSMEHGAIVFSTYEETGGGGAQFAGRFLQENFGVQQALISDVTLASESIKLRKGVAISMRDRGVPRQSYVRKIIAVAQAAEIPFQLEVESAGGSDGTVLQQSSYVWDWCFIGPPEENYHQPGEKVAKVDIEAMLMLYERLMEQL
jgi:putative aminopeptidase FrvX